MKIITNQSIDMQLLLIITAVSKKVDIATIKGEIKSYVGKRLIMNEKATTDFPGFLLKESLSIHDKQEIVSYVESFGTIAFIDVDDEDENVLDGIKLMQLRLMTKTNET